MDEPESMGAIGLAAREKLDNLIFVVNCNLQRLRWACKRKWKNYSRIRRKFSRSWMECNKSNLGLILGFFNSK